MRRINLGVFGTGTIWQIRHKPALKKLKERFTIKALCDVRKEIVEKEAREVGCDYTSDFRQIVERKDIEAISLLTPPTVRVEAIKEVCHYQKALYCEKPLALNLEEAKKIAELVKESGIIFTTEFVRRFFPATKKLIEVLTNSLGKPRLIFSNSQSSPVRSSVGNWMQNQKLSGGYMMDFGVHLVDLCRFFFQTEASAVQSFGGKFINQNDKINDYETLIVEFGQDKIAQVNVCRAIKEKWFKKKELETWARESPPSFTIITANGLAYLEPWAYLTWYNAQGRHYQEFPPVDIGVIMYENFYRFIVKDEAPSPNIDDAYRAVEIVLKGTEAREKQRRITF